ncbi:unnamed protein product [Pleuronectes platessa]|uniref:Uncharacterized protein n=1 Tax=Pleuronectes platessa TaxID=8262 RepID=A0A9N7TV95_PLEPL|nr:unnamed protein product [Pleuronectes platessa]
MNHKRAWQHTGTCPKSCCLHQLLPPPAAASTSSRSTGSQRLAPFNVDVETLELTTGNQLLRAHPLLLVKQTTPWNRGATSTKCRRLETQVSTFTRDKPARASACSSPGSRTDPPTRGQGYPPEGFLLLLFTHGAPELELEHRGNPLNISVRNGKRGEEDPDGREARNHREAEPCVRARSNGNIHRRIQRYNRCLFHPPHSLPPPPCFLRACFRDTLGDVEPLLRGAGDSPAAADSRFLRLTWKLPQLLVFWTRGNRTLPSGSVDLYN